MDNSVNLTDLTCCLWSLALFDSSWVWINHFDGQETGLPNVSSRSMVCVQIRGKIFYSIDPRCLSRRRHRFDQTPYIKIINYIKIWFDCFWSVGSRSRRFRGLSRAWLMWLKFCTCRHRRRRFLSSHQKSFLCAFISCWVGCDFTYVPQGILDGHKTR